MFTIAAAIAELERSIIVKQIRGGLRGAGEAAGKASISPSWTFTDDPTDEGSRKVKHLTEAIEHGKAGHADVATEHADAALTHLNEVKF